MTVWFIHKRREASPWWREVVRLRESERSSPLTPETVTFKFQPGETDL
ncbi:hypothetical protein [Metallosphaera yellowstonensis]|nr:hypothetical protein [Metallosphaera yellowstonensis]